MSGPSPRFRRVAGAALLALAALAAASVPAWRAFVGWARDTGRLAAWANSRPERLRITWRRLESPWPGRLEVEGLRVAGRTQRLAWEVTAEQVTASIAPLPLAARELRFTGVRARGVAVHSVRFALAERPGAAERLPAIAGFAGPAPPPPPTPLLPWSFSFHRLEVADFHDLWVDDRRYRGAASARGGFEIRRRALAEVLASRVEFRDVTLAAGAHEVARSLAGVLDFHVLPWHYRGAPAADVVRRFEGALRLSGEVEPDEALAYLFGSWPWLEIETEPSRIEADLHLRRGGFAPGSRLVLSSALETLRFLDFEARGRARLEARVEGGWPGHATVVSTLRLDGWRLGRPGEPPFLVGDGLRVEARADEPEVDRAPRAAGLELDLGEALVPDLRFLNDSIPAASNAAIESGSAKVTGSLRFAAAPTAGEGTITVRAPAFALRLGDEAWSGDVEADLRLSEPAFAPASFALTGSRVVLRDLVAPARAGAPAAGTAPRWWGELSLPEGRIVLARPFRTSGRFAARLADSRPLVALYELHRDLSDWAARLLTVEGVTIGGRYDWRPGRLVLDDLLAPMPHGEVRGQLDLGRAERSGRLLVTWRAFAVGLELAPEGRRLHLMGARAWYAAEGGVPGAAATP